MKRITLTLFLLYSMTIFSQSTGINYKALIKDNLGATVASQNIDVRFTIISDTGPTTVYSENHINSPTDANGIVILTIGGGSAVTGVFNDIAWGEDVHSLKVEIDIAQNGSFVDMGTTQFMSVPYAMHSKTAETVDNIRGTPNYLPKYIDGIAVGDSQLFDDGTNVGIGTTIPSSTLQVGDLETEGANYMTIASAGSNTSVSGVKLRHFSDDYGFTIESDDMLPEQGLNIRRHTNSTEGESALFIKTSNGNIGIGTSNPLFKFDLRSSGIGFNQQLDDVSPSIGFYTDIGTAYLQTHNNFPLFFATNNSSAQMSLNTNGNLGIGVVTAAAKLDIAGDIKIADGTQGAGKILTSDADGLASWQTPGTCGLAIGDTHQGGIVFYLDASGCHGLIAAPSDQSTGIVWFNGSFVDTYAYGNGIGAGEGNSQGIRRWQGTCSSCYASELCHDLSLGGYTDWYLPSKYELNLMYENIGQGDALGLGNIGNFANYLYWSSTEVNNDLAWHQFFTNGTQSNSFKTNDFNVRAVRAF